MKVTQKTNYPWDGDVAITVTPAALSSFTIYVRIPGWSARTEVSVNGKPVSGAMAGAYLPIRRSWSPGDTIRLQMDMTPQALAANPRVTEDNGRVAVQRGPIVYCLEQLDQQAGVTLSDAALSMSSKSAPPFATEFRSDLLGGVLLLRHPGAAYDDAQVSNALYAPYSGAPRKSRAVQLTLIPYYAWANREPSFMEVWTPVMQA